MAKLDKRRKDIAQVCGVPGVAWTVDGRYFDTGGNEIPIEQVIEAMGGAKPEPELIPIPEPKPKPKPEPEKIEQLFTEYSTKKDIMAELTRLGVPFNPRQNKESLYYLLREVIGD